MRRFATSVFVLLLAATAACGRDSATDPSLPGAAPGAVLRLEALTPTELETTVGESINPVPTVIVRNDRGEPVPGIKVTFVRLYPSDSANGDYVIDGVVKTDSRGLASPKEWTLGPIPGDHGLEASILGAHLSDPDGGGGRAIAFRTRGKAGPPARLRKDYLDDQIGLPGDEVDPPAVVVEDRFGNPVGGTIINFSVTSGGGSIEKTQVDARWGFASADQWTLGPDPGVNSAVASAPGLNSVTFNARALDAGTITWYDLPWGSIRLIVSASIALCGDGTFEVKDVELSDALTGEFRDSQFGKYMLSGNKIVLTYATGVTEEGTLVDDRLSLVHAKDNWGGEPPQQWNFVRRK